MWSILLTTCLVRWAHKRDVVDFAINAGLWDLWDRENSPRDQRHRKASADVGEIDAGMDQPRPAREIHPIGWGPTGVFVAMTVSFSLLAVVSSLLFRRGRWKEKVV